MPFDVLNIGCTEEYMCNDPRQYFPKGLHYALDVDPKTHPDFVADIRYPFNLDRKFDVVFMSHVLEHVERRFLEQTMKNLRDLLKEGGELWLFVPSLEWVCDMVRLGEESIVIQGSLYGGQKDEWDTHKIAFTVKALRQLLTKSGFKVKDAGVSNYYSFVNGNKYTCKQNVAVGVKC